MDPVRIFVSYNHEQDSRWFEQEYFGEQPLIPWLEHNIQEPEVEFWYDRKGLVVGDMLWDRIEPQIRAAHIAILLISRGFMNSRFIQQREYPLIEERARARQLTVIPVITRDCPWRKLALLTEVLGAPETRKPLLDYTQNEVEFLRAKEQILQELEEQVRKIRAAQQAATASVGAATASLPPVPLAPAVPPTTAVVSDPVPPPDDAVAPPPGPGALVLSDSDARTDTAAGGLDRVQRRALGVSLVDAARFGQLDAAKLLIAEGADVTATGEYDSTALYHAAERGDVELTTLLVQAGAPLDGANQFGWTPLHRAAWAGKPQTARVLLQAGANVNVVDQDGETPLCCAARFGSAEVAALLLEREADASIATRKGTTALSEALARGDTELAQLIRSAGAK